MTTKTTVRHALSRVAFVGTLAGVAVLVGPAGANKTPVTRLVFDTDQITLDPNQEAQGAVRAVFELFNQESSALGVMQRFHELGLLCVLKTLSA
jgi:hypothetical protein